MIVDAAMNDLIRPAMYEAHHDVVTVVEPAPRQPVMEYDIVGRFVKPGDTFAKERAVAQVKSDDLVAFRTAGAYGAVMASEYNSRPLVPESFGEGGSICRYSSQTDP